MTAPRDGIDVSFDALIALRLQARRQRGNAQPEASRAGGFAGRKRGNGLDIRDLRQFAEGDDLRHLDASATARTGKLHVRTFHEEQDRAALLIADFRHPMLWGTRQRLRSVMAAEALALAGWRISERGGKLALLVIREGGTDYVATTQHSQAMLRISGALERCHRDALTACGRRDRGATPQPLDSVIERATRLIIPGSTVIIATGLDMPGRGFNAAAGALAARARVTFQIVRDGLETDPPRRTLPYMTDDGTMAWGRFRKQTKDASIERDLRSLGATVEWVDAAHPFGYPAT